MKNITYILATLLLFACNNTPKEKTISKEKLIGAYTGRYDCGDCNFAKWTLALNEDGSFNLVYFEKKTLDIAKGNKGSWIIKEKQLELTSTDFDKPMVLEILNEHYLRTRVGGNRTMVLGKYEKGNAKFMANALKGVDVYGEGKTNNWNLSITLGKKVLLNHPAFTEILELPYTKPLPDYEKHTYTWLWAENGNNIELVISDETCNLGMPASMTLKVNGTQREGCVQYVAPNFLLQHAWQLKRFKGEDLIPERFSRGLPILEIDAFNVMGMGHTGCNIWSGGIKLNGDQIVIMPGAMTNLNCGWAEFERDYVSTIGQQWRINYLGDKLELWKAGKAVFEFVKLNRDATTDVTDE